jgi:hypothetical protein
MKVAFQDDVHAVEVPSHGIGMAHPRVDHALRQAIELGDTL